VPEGRITYVTVGWTTDTDDGPQQTVISLESMQKHCRAERVDDLLDDLTLLCRDVQDAWDAQGSHRGAPLRSVR
jgi:hypothetical protein